MILWNNCSVRCSRAIFGSDFIDILALELLACELILRRQENLGLSQKSFFQKQKFDGNIFADECDNKFVTTPQKLVTKSLMSCT